MKNNLILFLIIILLFLPFIFCLRLVLDEEDNRKLIEMEKIKNEKHFEEMEKRIRILEQDNYILKYGFETGMAEDDEN